MQVEQSHAGGTISSYIDEFLLYDVVGGLEDFMNNKMKKNFDLVAALPDFIYYIFEVYMWCTKLAPRMPVV